MNAPLQRKHFGRKDEETRPRDREESRFRLYQFLILCSTLHVDIDVHVEISISGARPWPDYSSPPVRPVVHGRGLQYYSNFILLKLALRLDATCACVAVRELRTDRIDTIYRYR